jgi:hypothetical protein
MRYLVMLDPSTPVGNMYARGTHDGIFSGAYPALDCTEISFDNPGYIYAIRENRAGLRQTLYLPAHTVVLILCYDVTQPMPIGFVPAT